ncbi:interleukin-8b.1 [Pseudorasbora parva]|uniref:interleukin-8b.1 n=1 Tax=Pseudorasbora parva TaxID=51549 RepID=UPI00351F1CA2
MKFTVAAFMFLICSLLSTTAQLQKAGTQRIYLRCQCLQTHSKPPIPIKKIISLKAFPAGPQCKNEEIIAQVKKGRMCLNPKADWVIALKEEVNKRNDTMRT